MSRLFFEALAVLFVLGALFALFLWMFLSAIADRSNPPTDRRRAPLAFEQRVRNNLDRDA